MIAPPGLAEWRHQAPWPQDLQVEQDLILSRALVELFQLPIIADAFAWRGGTALHKLHLTPPARFSKDIDLVQRAPEPIGPSLDAARSVLDSWLGRPQRKLRQGGVALLYRVETDRSPEQPLRLHIKINTRQHFSVFGIAPYPFEVRSRWFTGEAGIPSFQLPELLGTKLRALYQRKKGRDLFDLVTALERTHVDPERIVRAFDVYIEHEGRRVSRSELEANLSAKLQDPVFTGDLGPLLPAGLRWDVEESFRILRERLLGLLN